MNRSRAVRLAPALLAASIVALVVLHVLLDRDSLVVETAEASILLVFALALVFVTWRVVREEFSPGRVWRVVATGLVTGVVVGSLSALYLGARRVTNEPITEAWFIVSIGWSLGTSAGSLVGYYVERVRHERAAQVRVAGRLTVLQRVLRHNIRNEVTIMRGIAQSARASTEDPEVSAELDRLCTHVDRVYGLSEKAQTLANLWNDTTAVETDLAAAAREEVARFREEHPEASLSLECPDRADAVAHRDVAAAIRETLDNAAVHNDTAGLSVDVMVALDDDRVVVEVVDDGSSVPEEELAAIRATRELPLQHVTGLGLWVIYWIVELSEGSLEMENRDPEGVRVRMSFPAGERAAAQ
ncbi:ATP-binding protein [Halobaculum lipolyticum]|uniref:histidine kinase n=1 Tax=Halobaculum lipolyticum TaxID=3032001 RepID=A0ABD5W9A4_9EURY|nr:ATP-binding protein [Halobaculum sp. DT31]